MLIIDSHNHLLDEPNYAERLLETMDKLGISSICLSGLGIGGYDPNAQAARGLGSLSPTNEDVARLIARYPDRIVGQASLVLGKDGPDAVRYWRDKGFLGVKFTRPLVPYNHDSCFPVYEAAAELNMPGLFHTGFVLRTPQDAADDVDNDRMRPVCLDRVARRLQSWPIVMAHMSVPWFEEAAEMVRFHPNVYLDISCGTLGWRDRKSIDFFNAHFYWKDAFRKVIFGTDVHYRDIHDSLGSQRRIFSLCNLDQDTMRAIMGETMQGLLRKSAWMPRTKPCLEVVAQNVAELRLAQEHGAGRAELVREPLQGGLTPSDETLAEAAEAAAIPVMVMVRPRPGDFKYTDAEFDGMCRTLAGLRERGLPRQTFCRFGAVVGVQNAEGDLDLPRMARLAEAGKGLEMVCHMAFDEAADPLGAAKELVRLGYRRILCRGHKGDKGNDLRALEALKNAVGDKITVMPGRGILPEEVADLAGKGFIQQHLGIGVRQGGRPDGALLPDGIRNAAKALG